MDKGTKVKNMLKKIICLNTIIMMLLGNFITPITIFAEELNSTQTQVTEALNDGSETETGTSGVDGENEETPSREGAKSTDLSEESGLTSDSDQEDNSGENTGASDEESSGVEESDKKEGSDVQNEENSATETNNSKKAKSSSNADLADNNGKSISVGELKERIKPAQKDVITIKAKNDDYEIREFNIQFLSGAEKDENSNWVWTPENSAPGHEFSFRVNYALSGKYELPAEAVQITIPKSIIRNKLKISGDNYIMSLPKAEEYNEKTEFAYFENEDYIIVYNPKKVEAGLSGYFEISYAINSTTLNYRDYDKENTETVLNDGTASDPFRAVIKVDTGNDTLVDASNEEKVFIDTNAKLVSTQKCYPTLYREWDSSWMEKEPENSNQYYYLVWEVSTYVGYITQKYNFTLEDTIEDLTGGTGEKDYEFLGYKLSGEKYFSSNNKQEDLSTNEYRYDYVLTRHKIDTYKDKECILKNTITATVDPVDQVDEDTTASSSKIFKWTEPSFTIPTGHFNLFKYGNNNWYNGFGRHWNYASYNLRKLQDQEVDKLEGFKYSTETMGFAYPWTLRDGGSPDNPDDYGQNPVNYETWDDTLYLEDDTHPMNYNDYYLDYFTYRIRNNDVKYVENEKKFDVTSPTYEENEIVKFYGKFNEGTDWIEIGTYNLKTQNVEIINSEFVQGMTTERVKFKDGVHCTGWRVTTSNKHQYTFISVTPYFVLTNSEYVKQKIANKDSIQIQNKVSTKITDHNNKEIFSKEASAIDYARVTYSNSSISKLVKGVSNDVLNRRYAISWRVSASESATSENSISEYILQDSGKFYDLIPLGGQVDVNSIQVEINGGYLQSNEYTYELISNYKNSGRTMLIVNIPKQAYYYRLYYQTLHSWDSIKDYGRDVLNPVAYETGNEKITNGYADDGGKLSSENKELLKDLDATTDDEKFIYTEQTYSINAITSAVSGLYKKVKNSKDIDYSYNTQVEPDGSYSYQLRYQNTYASKSKNLVFFDSLENFKVQNTELGEIKSSGWKGELQSIDLNQIERKGIEPIVYMSTVENLDIEKHNDLTDKKIWTRVTIFKDLSSAKAIAIDMSKDKFGNDYTLDSGESVTAILHMKSPQEATEDMDKNPYTYNNVYIKNTLINELEGTQDYFIHQDYTTVKYRVVADVPFMKVNAKDENEGVKGITFKLYGNSIYGTEITEYATSNENGLVNFKDIEAGEYKLQEYEATPDWIEDHTVHTVKINNKKQVFIDEQLVTDISSIKIKNTPRIHADVTLKKRNLETKGLVEGAKFKLEGTSNYGNETLTYVTSAKNGNVKFEDLEYGTYELTELEAPEGYILNEEKYKVVVDENGNYDVLLENDDGKYTSTYDKGQYYIYNEPLHKFSLVKKDSYSNETIEGATFRLNGISDYGNSYYREITSNSEGLVNFDGLESGMYVLQETCAPEVTDGDGNKISYILDENKYIVTIQKDGTVNIDGLEKDYKGDFEFYNERNKEQITITKKWVDDKSNNDRQEPTIYISTEKPSRPEFQYFMETKELLRMMEREWYTRITGSFARNTELNEEEVKKLDAGRIDIDYDDEDAEAKIYGWIDESGNFWWWSNAEFAVMTDESNEMFCDCMDITKIDMTGIDTSKVTDMSNMFHNCSNLTELDVSGFNTSNVTNMSNMFSNCSALTELDVSGFDTGNVTNMSGMFSDCSALTELAVSGFDTGNVTNMGRMFLNCRALTELDVSGFDTGNVTNMSGMFSNCSNLTELEVNGFDTSNVTSISSMFNGCSKLGKLDVSNFDTSNVTDMSHMFSGCDDLTELDVSGFDTCNVTDMCSMFSDCSGLTELDLSSFDTHNVEYMHYMFQNCENLETIYASDNFVTDKVTQAHYMFYRCNKLRGERGTSNMGLNYDRTRACIDTEEHPGYFTRKEPKEKTTNTQNLSPSELSKVTNKQQIIFESSKMSKIDNLKTKNLPVPTAAENDEIEGKNGDSSKNILKHSTKDKNVDDKGKEIKWVKNGDTWTYTFYVEDPDATWYIWEEPLEGYISNYTEDNPGTVEDRKATVINMQTGRDYEGDYKTFTVEYGSLEISKELLGVYDGDRTEKIEDDDTEFTFNIKLTAKQGYENFIKGTKIFGNYIFKDGVGTVKVKAGETVTITDIPVGTSYEVTEENMPGYQVEGHTAFSGESGEITNEATKISVTNYKDERTSSKPSEEEKTASFTVTKKVTGNYEIEKSYNFEISLSSLKENTIYSLSNGTSFTSDSTGCANVSVSLKNNESVTVQNIPVESKYKVYEHAGDYISSYVITDSNNKGLINNSANNNTKMNKELSTATETADEGEEITITFTNEKNVTQNLKLAKTVTDENDKNSYIFEIKLANLKAGASFNTSFGKITANSRGIIETTVYLAGGEEAILYNIPVGAKYTVTELASSSIASYTVTDENGMNKIESASGANAQSKTALSTAEETVNEGEEVTVLFINDTVNQEPDSVTASLGVTKDVVNVAGEKLENCEDTFTFELTPDNETNPMPENSSITITGNGDASFGTITFTETGTYSYKITEKAGDLKQYAYDDSVYTIVYDITNTEGLLELTKTVKKNGFNSDAIVFTNRDIRADVRVSKIDDNQNPLSGATLQVLDANGNVKEEWVTDNNDEECLLKLLPGTYTLHEVQAPEGYELADDIEFIVNEDGTVSVNDKVVDAVIMVDSKIKEEQIQPGEILNEPNNNSVKEKNKLEGGSPRTGDKIATYGLIFILAGVSLIIAIKKKYDK